MRPARLITATLLALLLAGHLHAEPPTLDEIVRMQQEELASIRTLRLTATYESRPSPAFLEEVIKRMAAERFASEDTRPDDFYDTQQLLLAGPRNVSQVVDLDTGSYKSVTTDPRDLDFLIRENGLGDYAREKLIKTELTATVDGKNYSYDSASNLLHVLPGSPVSTHLHLPTLPDFPHHGENVKITSDPSDPSLYHVTFSDPPAPGSPPDTLPLRYDYVFDSSLSFRVVSRRTFTREGRRLDAEYEYSDFNGFTVPRSYRLTSYAEDGSLLSSYSYEYTSVEVNVPIDPSEFVLDVPADAAVWDDTGEPAVAAREDFPDIAPDLVPDVYPPGQAEPSLTGEVPLPLDDSPSAPPVPAEAAPDATPAPAAPVPTLLLPVALLTAALAVAIVALRLLKRRKRP